MMWNLKDLIKSVNTCSTEINGRWVPARPINYQCESVWTRLSHAWAVFTGKAEAFTWPEGQ